MKILIHAPSARSLARARLEAARLVALPLEGMVRVVATLEGAVAAVNQPDPQTDPLLVLCGDSLKSEGLANPPGMEVVPNGTELLAKLQRKGWAYVHG